MPRHEKHPPFRWVSIWGIFYCKTGDFLRFLTQAYPPGGVRAEQKYGRKLSIFLRFVSNLATYCQVFVHTFASYVGGWGPWHFLTQIASDVRFAIRITNRSHSQIARFGALRTPCIEAPPPRWQQFRSHLLGSCQHAKELLLLTKSIKTAPWRHNPYARVSPFSNLGGPDSLPIFRGGVPKPFV